MGCVGRPCLYLAMTSIIISCLIVQLVILISSSKMGSKNLEVDLGASFVEVHEMISNLKYCHTDLSPLF